MAEIRVLYINADGLQNEHSESADSIKVASLKTANYELTDSALGNLVGGADANDEHIHDARYFRENEHINTSAGAADAGKPIVLDAAGLIDNTMISLGTISHSSLGDLLNDDHTQYSLVDGTRDYSGVIKYASHPAFNDDLQLVDKKYVDDNISGLEWQDSVIDADTLAPPGSPSTGDRYLISGVGTGLFASHDNEIAEWNGAAWIFTAPTTGMHVAADDELDGHYVFGGVSWAKKLYEATTASTGLVKVGLDIRLDASAAGDGLGFAAGVLSANVDDSSIEIDTDILRVKALGIKDSMIDFGSGAGQVDASDLPVVDAGSFFDATNVETILQEIGQEIQQLGVEYTVGVGGVSIGDLVYISSADTVLPYSTITNSHRGIGIALSTETAAAQVKVLANDTQVSGLTIAGSPSVGDPIYWNGSSLSSVLPSGGGSYVWQAGVLVNTGLMHVEVRFVKKNA